MRLYCFLPNRRFMEARRNWSLIYNNSFTATSTSDASFEKVATYYVLLTWLYDAFNELPYLRLRGDYGSGKTRALLILGSLCYKGFFASGASTVSPIFHTLDAFRGTLIFDEADFRFSDEKAEIVKILNNGNVRGLPVLRTMMNRQREFNPQAFHVFGPKIVATRGSYDDKGLESRFHNRRDGLAAAALRHSDQSSRELQRRSARASQQTAAVSISPEDGRQARRKPGRPKA